MGRKKSQNLAAITCKVKEFRLKKGWSQETLASKLDIGRQAVYDIESGRYLPNTGIALRLARLFDCRVEDLFVEAAAPEFLPVQVVNGAAEPSVRLALGRVRDRVVGFPLHGMESVPFGLRSADGLLARDGKSARILMPADRVGKTILLMGCDPAFEILGQHVARLAPDARVHCRFASSHQALKSLAQGITHVAGTHLHNSGEAESNVEAVRQRLPASSRVFGFSLMEEGLMVAKGNPLGIRTVIDLSQSMVRFVNREPGAALRVLLDDHLKTAGVAAEAVSGYANEVCSHREGAYRILCGVADAALGLRAIAEVFGLGFVPITAARCDLVIPADLLDHPTIRILLDALQSHRLRNEIDALPGYESSATGQLIAELASP
ncbi:MAG: substrate-binding domain-containing protein [Desulfosarcinaceae bacterium]|jgi:molybdate-binding protein/DNA-binding XRE family transcriptional regulator